MSSYLQMLVPNLITVVPSMLLYVLGLSLCLVRRRSLGKASTYGSLGFGLLLLSALLSLGTQFWFVWMQMEAKASMAELGFRMGVVSALGALLWLSALSLLLAAILVRRPTQSV